MSFTVEPILALPEIKVVKPLVHRDDRGIFFESWRRDRFDALGLGVEFAQDNQSVSRQGVLRGLHYQLPPVAQGKLVGVAAGEVFDVSVDVRRSSPTFGKWAARTLSEESHEMLWIPPGFAHGFYAVSEVAVLIYKCTAPYSGEHDRAVRWDDSELAIDWPLEPGARPILSAKDSAAPGLRSADLFP